ncbi:hypothetical protein TrLO_g3171 [Triparma laevis f. longispina]|uniref:Vacuolar protein sorting-associated protein 54 n=1 Tax=Triparma laevis f. longispina TaxID=1714387 RepID=A0A9W7CI98_9STRA|nr:hypothetical protein TrLO_g3171 [Triparma laevis f. longispina]
MSRPLPTSSATPPTSKPVWALAHPPLHTPSKPSPQTPSPNHHQPSNLTKKVEFIEDHNLLSVIQEPAGTSQTSYFDTFWGTSSTSNQNELLERPKTQRDPPPYLQGLDVSNVEDFVNKTSAKAKIFTERMMNDDTYEEDEEDTYAPTTSTPSPPKHHKDSKHPPHPPTPPPLPLSTTGIPPCFFSPEFSLTSDSLFTSLLLQENGDYSDTKNFERQEELAEYLDTVEVHLLQQIRARSGDFFRETSRFQSLKTLVVSGCSEVHILRQTLASLRRRTVLEVLDVPVQFRVRDNLRGVEGILEKMKEVVEIKEGLGELIGGERFEEVIEKCKEFKKMMTSHNLTKITALLPTSKSVLDYETMAVTRMSRKFVDELLTYSVTNVEGNFDILPSAKVLKEAGLMQVASDLYAHHLIETIKLTVKATVTECAKDAHSKEGSITAGLSGMPFPQFLDCLEMLFEQILSNLSLTSNVYTFLSTNGIEMPDPNLPECKTSDKKSNGTNGTNGTGNGTPTALTAASELAHRSISELLRIRKDSHSLLSLKQMKQLWDVSLAFTLELETHGGVRAWGLRSTLLSQAKGFIERSHEGHMTSLVATLDGEKWQHCGVSKIRQAGIDGLCSGKAVLGKGVEGDGETCERAETTGEGINEADVEGVKFKVVWSCLLLVEMLMNNLAAAAHFQSLANDVVSKVSELLRLFNSRTTQLVLGAGAIHSAAKLKSINAKHLALASQCLGLVSSLLPHIRAALMAQLPRKQHMLLSDLDKIKQDINEHGEKILAKFVSIVASIVESSLAPSIMQTNFDAVTTAPPFLEGILKNVTKLHQVLVALLPPDQLDDVFGRIYNYLDTKVPELFQSAHDYSTNQLKAMKIKQGSAKFFLPKTEGGKERMIAEVGRLAVNLNGLLREGRGNESTPYVDKLVTMLRLTRKLCGENGENST